MPRRKRWIIRQKPRMFGRWGINFSYAGPGGGPVLIENAIWRNINGLRVTVPAGTFWLLFRRRFW